MATSLSFSYVRQRVEVDEFMAEFPAPHFHSYFHDLAAHAQRVPRCGNRISDVGICALLSCVAVPERPTGLTSLDLCGNPASMKSVLFLCESCARLYVRMNNICMYELMHVACIYIKYTLAPSAHTTILSFSSLGRACVCVAFLVTIFFCGLFFGSLALSRAQ